MLQSRKELSEKYRKAVFTTEIVTKNPVFSKEHCEDFFEMFNLYCDSRRQCDVSDILITARTLGFDQKYKIIFQAISSVSRELASKWVNFETFLTLVTNRVGNPFTESGRQAMFSLVDAEEKGKLQFQDLKRISEHLKYNLSDEQIQEVINNVAGFGKKEISKDQFNKYIVRKLQRK